MAGKDQQADGVANEDEQKPATSPLREEPLSEELTGRATGTDDDLTALFRNDTQDHFADGFKGGSDDDVGVAIKNDGDITASDDEDEPAPE